MTISLFHELIGAQQNGNGHIPGQRSDDTGVVGQQRVITHDEATDFASAQDAKAHSNSLGPCTSIECNSTFNAMAVAPTT